MDPIGREIRRRVGTRQKFVKLTAVCSLPDADFFAGVAGSKPVDKGRREGDFRKQEKRLPILLQNVIDRAQIELGLSRMRDAAQQKRPVGFSVHRLDELGEDVLLLGTQTNRTED